MYLERGESLVCKIYVSLDIILFLQTCYYTELKQNNQVLEKMFFYNNTQTCKLKQ